MSGSINADIRRINPSTTMMSAETVDPSRPILAKTVSNSGNYSSTEQNNQSNFLKERKNLPISPPGSSRGSGSTYSYEELSSGLTCPTCKGTGKIPRGQEDDLVALIPYNDKRLRPQRTCLYVFLSFLLCAAIAGLLCAFLIPRSIAVVHYNVTTLNVDLNVTEDRCNLSLLSIYNITNNNFVQVTTNDILIQVTVTFSKQVVANSKIVINKAIPIRATEQLTQNISVSLTQKVFPIDYCVPSQAHQSTLFMYFQSTFNFTLMTQTDQQVVTGYFRVNCNPDKALDDVGSPHLEAIDEEEYLEAVD